VKRFAAAAASGNGDGLAELFTPDGIYEDYFFGPSIGREAIKAMLAHFAEGGRDFRWEFFDPVRSGSIGYASYRFSFDSTHPAANGARVVFDGIGRFDLRGTASGATPRCSTVAWPWPSRRSPPSACAGSRSATPTG
jgi:hypothetical protein